MTLATSPWAPNILLIVASEVPKGIFLTNIVVGDRAPPPRRENASVLMPSSSRCFFVSLMTEVSARASLTLALLDSGSKSSALDIPSREATELATASACSQPTVSLLQMQTKAARHTFMYSDAQFHSLPASPFRFSSRATRT